MQRETLHHILNFIALLINFWIAFNCKQIPSSFICHLKLQCKGFCPQVKLKEMSKSNIACALFDRKYAKTVYIIHKKPLKFLVEKGGRVHREGEEQSRSKILGRFKLLT